jgi:hypothetical protein
VNVLAGRTYWLVLAGLLTLVAAVVAFMVVGILPEMRAGGYVPATPTPSASASMALPTGSPDLLMNGALVPSGAECSGCHLTDRGVIGLRPIPEMGHPLEGWTDCTACHSTSSLVNTAPGHTGIHATECITCHMPADLPAPLSRPHRDRQNMACLECHGSVAPLPTDMTHRSELVCWICHRLPDEQPPVPAHETVAGETDCLTCHVDGRVGALPPDHDGRTGSECLLCHDTPLGASPQPAARVDWPGAAGS